MLNPDDLDSGEARSYFKIRRSAPADELGRRVLAHSGSRTPFARFTPSERATLETWAQALGCNAPSAHTSMTVRIEGVA